MTIPARPIIGRQNSAYRQGVILGLTMAETFLLLVFCLMLVLAALLKRAHEERDRATVEREALAAQVADLKKIVASTSKGEVDPSLLVNPEYMRELIQMTGSAERAKLDDAWRRIVRNDDAARKLAAQGVDVASLTRAEIDAVRQKPGAGDRDQMRKQAESYANIRADLEKAGLKPTDRQIVDTVVGAARSEGHKWPPIIKLSEAGGYSFAVGSAELAPAFAKIVQGPVVDKLVEIAKEYDVDVIEVVGHTDEQPIAPRPSNLDKQLPSVIGSGAHVNTLRPADNAGLGLSRAASIVTVLRSDARLAPFKILPLSGAQLINVDETLARGGDGQDAKERRRIEIRMRKSGR